MKCKSKFCDLESGHIGRCARLTAEITAEPAINAEEVISPNAINAERDITPNRRDRKAYNAYMRDYMRARRGKRT